MIELRYHPKVKHDLKQLSSKLRDRIKEEYLPYIKKNPEVGDSLKGNLNDILSYHFKENNVQYRVAYLYSKNQETATILMIAKRENFYTILSRRI